MSGILLTILKYAVGLIGIGFVILVHELGHFFAAKAMGVQVETLGIGMGPALFTIHGKNTDYRFSLIPFGGYCQMEGSIDLVKALRDDEKSFSKAEYGSYFTTTPLTRIIIFIAGPLINFLLAVLLFFIVSMIPAWQAVHDPKIVIVSDYPSLFGSDITQSELRTGDYIISIDGKAVSTFEEAEKIISAADKAVLPMTIKRDGKIIDVNAYGVLDSGTYRYGIALYQEPVIGRVEGTQLFQSGDVISSVNGIPVTNAYDLYQVSDSDMNIKLIRDGKETDVFLPSSSSFPFAWQSRLIPLERDGFFKSIASSLMKAADAIKDTVGSLLNLINLNREEVRNEITGPARAALTIGTITTLGIQTGFLTGLRAFIYLLSLVSVSLCVANLIPIPTFDGGQILINIYQMITGNEMKPKSYVIFHIIGLVFTVVILVAMYSLDVLHYLNT